MPLFRRPDGDLVRDLPPVRRIMPYLMRTKAESVVLQDTVLDVRAARAWLKAYNRSHAQRATLFHLVAYACACALHARPHLNRFVSGGRYYQRRVVSIAFVAKAEMTDAGAGNTVKVDAPPGEAFGEFVARTVRAVHASRAGRRAVDREIALVMALPGPVVRLLVALVRALDAWNLVPGWFMRDDPMYASVFLANLGSAGVEDAYHHLFEYGTCGIFGAISSPRRMPFVDGDAVVVREGLRVRFTFDERVHDGFYGGRSIAVARRIVEDPERHLGPADGAPAFQPDAGSAPELRAAP